MAAAFVGKWKLVSSENFEDFMKAIGVGMIMRKAASTSKPTVEIQVSGDDWTITTTTTFKTTELKFTVGKQFREKRMDDVEVDTVVTLEGNKLVQKQFGDKEVNITREIEGGKLKVVCAVEDIVSTRFYEKA